MSGEDRRAQLLDVARRCFAKHGFHGTTTARIANGADVSEPVLYQHFENKLGLFHALLEEVFETSNEHTHQVVRDHDTGAAKLRALIADYPSFTVECSEAFQVLDRALAGSGDQRAQQLLQGYYRDYAGRIQSIVSEGQEDGSIRAGVDAKAVSWMLLMTGIGFRLLNALDDEGEEDITSRLAGVVEWIVAP